MTTIFLSSTDCIVSDVYENKKAIDLCNSEMVDIKETMSELLESNNSNDNKLTKILESGSPPPEALVQIKSQQSALIALVKECLLKVSIFIFGSRAYYLFNRM